MIIPISIWIIVLLCFLFCYAWIRMRSKVWRQLLMVNSRVFISHRQSDTKATAQRLCKDLQEEFGIDAVFIDDGGVASGQRFPEVILTALRNSDTVFIIIGPNWDIERLHKTEDWVRREIFHALQYRVAFPVLVDGARMPTKSDLPSEIQTLIEINAEPLSNGEEYKSNYEILANIVRRNSPALSVAKQIQAADKWSLGLMCLTIIGTSLAATYISATVVDEASKTREEVINNELSRRIREFPFSFQEFAKRPKGIDAKNVKVVWTGYVRSKSDNEIVLLPETGSLHSLTLSLHPDSVSSKPLEHIEAGMHVTVVARIFDLSLNYTLSGELTDIYTTIQNE